MGIDTQVMHDKRARGNEGDFDASPTSSSVFRPYPDQPGDFQHSSEHTFHTQIQPQLSQTNLEPFTWPVYTEELGSFPMYDQTHTWDTTSSDVKITADGAVFDDGFYQQMDSIFSEETPSTGSGQDGRYQTAMVFPAVEDSILYFAGPSRSHTQQPTF